MTAPWRWFWEPLPPGTITDDHGQPAVWIECDDCDRWSLCQWIYEAAAGPCQLYPYAEDEHGEPMELGDPRLDGGGFMCSNCVPSLAFCADREACKREAGLRRLYGARP